MINNKVKDYDIVLELQVGSHLYGTNTPSSDLDYTGIIMPKESEVFGYDRMEQLDVSIKDKDSTGRNTKDAVDKTFYEFRKFVKLAKENNPNILEVLFVDDKNIIQANSLGRELLSISDKFVAKDILYTKFSAYMRSQFKKMLIKPENYFSLNKALESFYGYVGSESLDSLVDDDKIIKSKKMVVEAISELDQDIIKIADSFIKIGDLNLNKNSTIKQVVSSIERRIKNSSSRKDSWERYGFDTKFCSNSVRLSYEAIELLNTGRIEFPLKERETLLGIKNGMYTLHQVEGLIEHLSNEVDKAYEKSDLQRKADSKFINQWVIDNMRKYFYKSS